MSYKYIDYVVTLISSNIDTRLEAKLLQNVQESLENFSHMHWLNQNIAADLFFTNADIPDVETNLRAALGNAPIDIIVQPVQNRRKKLFLADMDSTMIRQECIDELAAFAGLKTEVSEITERAMRGELEFEPALRKRVSLLKGLNISIVDEIIANHITLNVGGRELVQTMRANEAYTCLVSGGFTLFTSKIGAMIGFNEDRSNLLELEGNILKGTVREPILGKEAKLSTLMELRSKLGLKAYDTLAVGDGANDLAMLCEAGLGVAFRAKPAVAAAAHARIEHTDLTALLYAQGYSRESFVT